VTAAKAAGIFCVAVPNPVTSGLALDHADLRVSSFTEISVSTLIELFRGGRGMLLPMSKLLLLSCRGETL